MHKKCNGLSVILFSRFKVAGLALLMLLTSGCANFYVDTMTKDLQPQQIRKVENPKPVQLLFEFQTKGATNTTATEYLKADVTAHTKASGLFSEISTGPVPNNAVLSLTIENVPLTDNAAGRGFVTGLTFGIAGSTVTDGYICRAVYISGSGNEKIVKVTRHAIHTALGAQSAPAGAVASESIEAAVRTMTRQIVTNALNDLASDPQFK